MKSSVNDTNQTDKHIAWNKIFLSVPATWEVDSIDVSHLLIGEKGSPKVEIKWAESPKQFTLASFLKTFMHQVQKQLGIMIHERPTPNFFSHSTDQFEFFFFTWEGHGSKGDGTLIFCNQCKRLSLIRFFKTFQQDKSGIFQSVLHSFFDHPEDDKTRWAIFGMDVQAPGSYDLKSYEFKPGAFRIELKGNNKTDLTFFSWGPASFLLAQTDLSMFAMQRVPGLSGFAKAGLCHRGKYLDWSFKQERFKNARIIPYLDLLSRHARFRICHDQEQNRIFGIWISSAAAFDPSDIIGPNLGDI